MKKTYLILIVFLLCIFYQSTSAQLINDESPTNITFTINLNTNMAIIDCSVLNFEAQVINLSSNEIYIHQNERTALYLTNDLGLFFELTPLTRLDFDRRTGLWRNIHVNIGDTNHWANSFRMSREIWSKKIVPGVYMLIATQKVFTSDNKSHQLVSNPVNLELRNFDDIYTWGKTVDGMQLSINLDTNVLVVGETNHLTARVRNLSTNTIAIMDVVKTGLSLTDSSGHVYELPPQNRSDWDGWIFLQTTDNLGEGDIKEWPLIFTIEKQISGKKVVPGAYTLQATRDKLISNPVEVQIK